MIYTTAIFPQIVSLSTSSSGSLGGQLLVIQGTGTGLSIHCAASLLGMMHSGVVRSQASTLRTAPRTRFCLKESLAPSSTARPHRLSAWLVLRRPRSPSRMRVRQVGGSGAHDIPSLQCVSQPSHVSNHILVVLCACRPDDEALVQCTDSVPIQCSIIY